MTNIIKREEVRDGVKGEAVYQEVSFTPLTEENLVEAVLKKYISDETTAEDIIVELKSNNII